MGKIDIGWFKKDTHSSHTHKLLFEHTHTHTHTEATGIAHQVAFLIPDKYFFDAVCGDGDIAPHIQFMFGTGSQYMHMITSGLCSSRLCGSI
jgi:hypothetical protein